MKKIILGALFSALPMLSLAATEISHAIALHGQPALAANFSAFAYYFCCVRCHNLWF